MPSGGETTFQTAVLRQYNTACRVDGWQNLHYQIPKTTNKNTQKHKNTNKKHPTRQTTERPTRPPIHPRIRHLTESVAKRTARMLSKRTAWPGNTDRPVSAGIFDCYRGGLDGQSSSGRAEFLHGFIN